MPQHGGVWDEGVIVEIDQNGNSSVQVDCQEEEVFPTHAAVNVTTYNVTAQTVLGPGAPEYNPPIILGSAGTTDTLTPCNPILSADLGHFMATRTSSSNVILDWETLSETNTDRFVIERSLDASTFTPMLEMKAQGFSSQVHSYTLNDDKATAKVIYYKLVSYDHDGSRTEYFVRAVDASEIMNFTTFPNPVVDKLVLRFGLETIRNTEIEITDILGVTTYKENLGEQQGVLRREIDMSSLPSGLYFITVKAGDQKLVNRVIKS